MVEKNYYDWLFEKTAEEEALDAAYDEEIKSFVEEGCNYAIRKEIGEYM